MKYIHRELINYFLLSVGFILIAPSITAQSQLEFGSGTQQGETMILPQVGIQVVKGSKERIPIRKLAKTAENRSVVSCTDVSTFDPTYEADMPAAAETAFDYALGLLSDIYISSVDITIDVVWEDVPGNVIGFAGSGAWRKNYSFFPEYNLWYPEALTNEYNGSQLYSSADINVTLDSSANWYFGTDGNPGWNEVDLVTVIIHEVSHGMGFAGTAQSDGTPSGTSTGWIGTPNIYDPFIVDGTGTDILSIPNYSTLLVDALVSDDLYFDGIYTNGSNDGTPPKIKSDASWAPGSSYSHLADGFANETMRSFIVTGDAIHTLDLLGVAMLRDMGWAVCIDNCPSEMTVSNNNELDGIQNYSAAYESDGVIESHQEISSGIEVHYDSKIEVELLEGFEVDANTDFQVLINGCGDN